MVFRCGVELMFGGRVASGNFCCTFQLHPFLWTGRREGEKSVGAELAKIVFLRDKPRMNLYDLSKKAFEGKGKGVSSLSVKLFTSDRLLCW